MSMKAKYLWAAARLCEVAAGGLRCSEEIRPFSGYPKSQKMLKQSEKCRKRRGFSQVNPASANATNMMS
eukprot:1459019-Amphidinium_carterae.2